METRCGLDDPMFLYIPSRGRRRKRDKKRECFILFVCSYTTHLSQVLSMEAHQRIAAKELSDSTIRAELFYLHSVKEMEWGGLSEIAPAGAAIYHT